MKKFINFIIFSSCCLMCLNNLNNLTIKKSCATETSLNKKKINIIESPFPNKYNIKRLDCLVNFKKLSGRKLDIYLKIFHKMLSDGKSNVYAKMYADTNMGGLPKFLSRKVANIGEKTFNKSHDYTYSIEYAIGLIVGHLSSEVANEFAHEIIKNTHSGTSYKEARKAAIIKYCLK